MSTTLLVRNMVGEVVVVVAREGPLTVADVKRSVHETGMPTRYKGYEGMPTRYKKPQDIKLHPFPCTQILVIDGEPAEDDHALIPEEHAEVQVLLREALLEEAEDFVYWSDTIVEIEGILEEWKKLSTWIREDRAYVLRMVRCCWELYEEALPIELQTDRAIAMAAVAQNGEMLEYVGKKLLADRDLVLLAAGSPRFSDEYMCRREGIGQSLDLHFSALRIAAPPLRADRRIVMAAVRRAGLELKYASPHLRGDRDVVLAAVRENGKALRYALAPLRADREVILAATGVVSSTSKMEEPLEWFDSSRERRETAFEGWMGIDCRYNAPERESERRAKIVRWRWRVMVEKLIIVLEDSKVLSLRKVDIRKWLTFTWQYTGLDSDSGN